MRSRFLWVGQRNDVEEWCRRCTECASRKSPPAAQGPMKVAIIGMHFQRVAMDMIRLFPKTAKAMYSATSLSGSKHIMQRSKMLV